MGACRLFKTYVLTWSTIFNFDLRQYINSDVILCITFTKHPVHCFIRRGANHHSFVDCRLKCARWNYRIVFFFQGIFKIGQYNTASINISRIKCNINILYLYFIIFRSLLFLLYLSLFTLYLSHVTVKMWFIYFVDFICIKLIVKIYFLVFISFFHNL